METLIFVVGIILGSLFTIMAAITGGVLVAHMYVSLRASVTVLLVQIALSLLCFYWAMSRGKSKPKGLTE